MFDGLDQAVTPLYIAPNEVFRWADKIAPALLKMAEGSCGRYQASDIAAALISNRMQLWLVLDGAAIGCVLVTEIIQYPRKRAMRCIGLVGHRPRKWMHLLQNLEDTARKVFGCDLMEAFLPQGFERLLRTGGWSQFHVLWEKAL